jgi:hypothetical protein
MSSFRTFWSKPKARAVVYSIGFILTCVSYVAGAPTFKVDKQKPKRLQKPKTVTEAPIQETIPEPVAQEATPLATEQAPLIQTNSPVIASTAPSAAIASNNLSAPTLSEPFAPESSFSEPMAYPVDQMNVPPEVKQKIAEKVAEPSKPYPYLVEEERDENESANKDKDVAASSQSVSSWNGSGAVGNKKESKPAATQSEQKNNSSTTSSSSKPSFVDRAKSFFASDVETEEAKENEPKMASKAYSAVVDNPVPSWLQNFYSRIHVYSFMRGVGGSIDFSSFNQGDEPNDLRSVIFAAPDWDLKWDLKGLYIPEAIKKHILPLGTKGSLTIEIVGGYIEDKKGKDFVIFENPFCSTTNEKKESTLVPVASVLDRPSNIACMVELAKVEVSDAIDGEYYAFPCELGDNHKLRGCAGIVPNVHKLGTAFNPVLSGGDMFDLADLKLEKGFQVKYIRITDLGGEAGIEGTVGFDLDAFVPLNIKGL